MKIYLEYKLHQVAESVKSSFGDLKFYAVVYFGIFLFAAWFNLHWIVMVYALLFLAVLYFIGDYSSGSHKSWWRDNHGIPSAKDIVKMKKEFKELKKNGVVGEKQDNAQSG